MKSFLMILVVVLTTSCSLESCSYALDFSVTLPTGVTTADQALEWTAKNIGYDFDRERIFSTRPGNQQFWQTPKETLAKRTGLCIDYVSLAVAMLQKFGYDVKMVLTHLPGEKPKSHSCIIWQGKTFETETGQFVDYPKDYVFSWGEFQQFVDDPSSGMRTSY